MEFITDFLQDVWHWIWLGLSALLPHRTGTQ